MLESLPHFEYIPVCETVDCIAQRLVSEQLDLEGEVLEFTHLRYDKGIPTVKLFAAINALAVDETIKDEMRDALLVVSSTDIPPEAQVTLNPHLLTLQQLRDLHRLVIAHKPDAIN